LQSADTMDIVFDVRHDPYPAWFGARTDIHQGHLWWRSELRYATLSRDRTYLYCPGRLHSHTHTHTCAEFPLLLLIRAFCSLDHLRFIYLFIICLQYMLRIPQKFRTVALWRFLIH